MKAARTKALSRGLRRRRRRVPGARVLVTVALALTAGLCASIALGAEIEGDPYDLSRDGSAANPNFDHNKVDDHRVDAEIAVLDKGIGKPGEVPGINLVHRTDCVNPDPFREAEDPKYTPARPEDPKWSPPEGTEWKPDVRLDGSGKAGPYGCLDNSGAPWFPLQKAEGGGVSTVTTEGRSRTAAEIDGTEGGLGGVAPGARIWSVRVLAGGENFGVYPNPLSDPKNPKYDPKAPAYLPELGTAHLIAGLDWVAAHADQIDVVEMAIGCAQKGNPEVEEAGLGYVACDDTVLDEAIEAAIDKGVVIVDAAGNGERDTDVAVPRTNPDVLTVSAVGDADGKPGGLDVEGCGSYHNPDDQLSRVSNFGLLVDIAAAKYCGDTSGASAKLAGAAAALASQCHPSNRAGVEFIVDTLIAEGDTGGIKEGGWEDDSGDGWKEPFLDLRNEKVFTPVMVGKEPPAEGCQWRSRQAESDVNSDGRADLVTVNGKSNSAEVFAGTSKGFETASPTTSLEGQLDPALLDNEGEYPIDTADVDGDRHADLITFSGGHGVYVHKGNAEGGFGTAIQSLKGATLSFDGSEGELEPIAAADVNNDGRADLVTQIGGSPILTFPGQAGGTFGSVLASSLTLDSALLDGKGNYYLDVIDVNGDGYADLVTSNTNGTVYVYPGKSNGKFQTTGVAAASVNPIMDDGKGEEPIGLGDVNRDHRADLLTLDGETLKLRIATKEGTFESAKTAYSGKVDSSLLDGKGQELIGLLDYSRDGLADLVSVTEGGEVLTYTAQRNATFAEPVGSEGPVPSLRNNAAGHEFFAEKPFLRGAGCSSGGCVWQPPATAPRFRATTYAATLKGTGLNSFTLGGAPFTCTTSSLSAALPAPATTLALSAEYSGCLAFGEFPTTIAMNSCHYTLAALNAGPPYTGTLGVGCEKAGDGIEITASLGKTVLCRFKLAAQGASKGVSLANLGSGSERKIEVQPKVETLEYELTSGKYCEAGHHANGKLSGNATLTGQNEAAQPDAAYLTGKEVGLEAGKYPATLVGHTQSFQMVLAGGSLSCSGADFEATLGEPSSLLAASSSEASGCGSSTVKMNGCHYTFSPRPKETKGTFGIGPRGCGPIAISTFSSPCITIGSQSGLAASYVNGKVEGHETVSITAEAEGLKYVSCGISAENGQLLAKWTLKGTDAAGNPVDVRVSG